MGSLAHTTDRNQTARGSTPRRDDLLCVLCELAIGCSESGSSPDGWVVVEANWLLGVYGSYAEAVSAIPELEALNRLRTIGAVVTRASTLCRR